MDIMRGRGRGRRQRTRTRGRPKKNADLKEDSAIPSEDEEQSQPEPVSKIITEPQIIPKSTNFFQAYDSVDMEADISQLEAPTFTTINRGPPEAMLRLRWGHPVNLIGEKVLNPMIHCCDQCLHPVLIYGRMIPCKHVFCLSCAKTQTTECPRCKEKLVRVEETSLGTLFMCTHGGSRYGNNGCRRTYLSERDLQAHINHRHVVSAVQVNDHLNQFPIHNPQQKVNDLRAKVEPRVQPAPAPHFYDNQKLKMYEESDTMNYGAARPRETNNSLNRSSNLITVPLQGQPQDPYYLSYNTIPGYYQTPYQDFTAPPPQTDVSVPPNPQWTNNQQFYG